MKTQKEHIEEILKLSDENPEAKIKLCVDNDMAVDFGWTAHRIVRVKLCDWIEVDDYIHTDECIAKDYISDMLYEDETKNLPESEYKELVNKYYQDNAVSAICVFTAV